MVEATHKAVADDLDSLVSLYRGVADALSVERGGAALLATDGLGEPLEDGLAKLLCSDECLVEIGTLDEVAVGLVVAGLAGPAGQPVVATVKLLYVEEAARGIGIGELLMDAVLRWAGDRGAAGIDVPVLPGMRQSKNFLEGAGFRARLLVMRRGL